MTNKEFILKISDATKEGRMQKILSFCTRPYVLQESGDITNIILPAKDKNNKVSVISHYDVYPGSAGFNDNSSGVVTLLKLQDRAPDNVELVFTDGEDSGGNGCELYLSRSPKPRMAINIDVVGLGNRIFYEKYADTVGIKVDESKMTLYENIPFSDSHILERHRVPNILMLTGYSKETLIKDIFDAQHCGRYDGDINRISEDVMNMVFEVLSEVISNNS